MNTRRFVTLLGMAAAVSHSSIAGAQAPGDRVRVHLLGLRTVEDTVVGWSGDSLIGRHELAATRGQIIGVDVWRPRSFVRSAMRYGSMGTGLTGLAVQVGGKQGPDARGNSIGGTMAVGAGIGLVAAIIQRLRHRGEWVSVGADRRPGGR
jgi:hypothetical protein